jgi:hypothetical protein
MGNIKSCCKTPLDRDNEKPPPWLAKDAEYAPSIPDSIDSQFRLAAYSKLHNLHHHDAGLNRLEPSPEPTISQFHHARPKNGQANAARAQEKATRNQDQYAVPRVPSNAAPKAACLDRSVHMASAEDTSLIDANLHRVLGSVLDTCYLLCHDFEWHAWQGCGTVGQSGSRVYSRLQAREMAASFNIDRIDDPAVDCTMVLEIQVERCDLDYGEDLECGMTGDAGGVWSLRLASAVKATAVRSVYRLEDFVTIARANINAKSHPSSTAASLCGGRPVQLGGEESINSFVTTSGSLADDRSVSGPRKVEDSIGRITMEEKERHQLAMQEMVLSEEETKHSYNELQRKALHENLWMLEDFEEMLIRRRHRCPDTVKQKYASSANLASPATSLQFSASTRALREAHATISMRTLWAQRDSKARESKGPGSNEPPLDCVAAWQDARGEGRTQGQDARGERLREAAERLHARTAGVVFESGRLRGRRVVGDEGGATTYPRIARRVDKRDGPTPSLVLALPVLRDP